jgi:hypothetical protein
MTVTKVAAALVAGLLMAGCVGVDRPTTKTAVLSVEEQKKEIASLRDRGVINFEEAARRQFEIQRNNYALSEGEYSFWRASIEYAKQVDEGRITVAQYRQLTAEAYARFVPKRA